MNEEEIIKMLQEFIDIDRTARGNKVESDYDNFCEQRCKAIERNIRFI